MPKKPPKPLFPVPVSPKTYRKTMKQVHADVADTIFMDALQHMARRAEQADAIPVKAKIQNPTPPATLKIRWTGPAYELARKVRDELAKAGQDITARGVFTAGLEQACTQYENSKGKPFTPKILRESLRQWELKNL